MGETTYHGVQAPGPLPLTLTLTLTLFLTLTLTLTRTLPLAQGGQLELHFTFGSDGAPLRQSYPYP